MVIYSLYNEWHHNTKGLAIPNFSIWLPPAEAYQCKGTPTCPSTAYQGAKTHCIYIVWMWDAVCGALKPQPWLYNITQTQPYPQYPKNPPPPSEAYQCKGTPRCPFTAYQGAKTLCIYNIIWMWDAVYGALKPQLLNHDFTTYHSDSDIIPISQKSTTFRGVSV